VAPCGPLGFVRYGPPVNATARPLAGAQAGQAASRLASRYPAWHRLVTALALRVTGWRLVYYELRADAVA
jgi:type VI protein secretion system component VasF